MYDIERAELDLRNSITILRLHLDRLDVLSRSELPKVEKQKLAYLSNSYSSKLSGLAKTARKVTDILPRVFN